MNEKRFILCQDDLGNYEIRYDDKVFHFLWEVAPILNELQATIKVYEEGLTMKIKKINEQQSLITNLQGDVNRLQYIIDELKKDNYKRFEKINELKAKLKEKEEDEQLYANEIVELRKTNEEWLQFKDLGGDY